MYTFNHTLPIKDSRPLTRGVKATLIQAITDANLDFSEHINQDTFDLYMARLAIETPDGFENRVVNIDGNPVETKLLFQSRAKAIQERDLNLYMELDAGILSQSAVNFIAGKHIDPTNNYPGWFLAKVHRTKDHEGNVRTSYVILINIEAHPYQGDEPKWFNVKIDHSLMNSATSKNFNNQGLTKQHSDTISALGHILPNALISLLEYPND